MIAAFDNWIRQLAVGKDPTDPGVLTMITSYRPVEVTFLEDRQSRDSYTFFQSSNDLGLVTVFELYRFASTYKPLV